MDRWEIKRKPMTLINSNDRYMDKLSLMVQLVRLINQTVLYPVGLSPFSSDQTDMYEDHVEIHR